jgi:hypothetical protein
MSDHLIELEGLIERLPDAVSQRRLGDYLNQATEKLKGAPQSAVKLDALLSIAAAADFMGDGDPEHVVNSARHTAIELGVSLAEANDESSLREALWAYDKEFVPAMGRLDRAVRSRIRARALEEYHPLIAYGALLGNIAATADLGARLTAFGRKATAATDQLAPAELLATVQAHAREYLELQAARTALVGAVDVGAFLNALAERRATLEMITPEVWAWLTENKALGQFSVSPS